jgi:hypothetical protein
MEGNDDSSFMIPPFCGIEFAFFCYTFNTQQLIILENGQFEYVRLLRSVQSPNK